MGRTLLCYLFIVIECVWEGPRQGELSCVTVILRTRDKYEGEKWTWPVFEERKVRENKISAEEKAYWAQIFPVQQVAESFRAVTLDDTLATGLAREVKQILRQLTDRFFRALETPIHNVNPVGLGVLNVVLHETPETGQVRGDARDTHHRAFRCTKKSRIFFRKLLFKEVFSSTKNHFFRRDFDQNWIPSLPRTRCVAPRLVVRREHAQVATANKVVIVHRDERTGRGKKFRVEDDLKTRDKSERHLLYSWPPSTQAYLHAVRSVIDEVAPS